MANKWLESGTSGLMYRWVITHRGDIVAEFKRDGKIIRHTIQGIASPADEKPVWETEQVCLRCGAMFIDPYPEVVNPERDVEIASVYWCAKCNKAGMSAALRQGSAYYEKGMRPAQQHESMEV